MATETKKVVPEGDVKQGRRGTHVATILAASLALAAIAALVFIFMGMANP